MGFNTRIAPRVPPTRTPAPSTWRDSMDAVINPVQPPGKASSAVSSRSTPVRRVLAVADETSGSGARERPQQVDGVAAGIHQRSTSELEVPPDVIRLHQREAEPGLQSGDVAQLAGVEISSIRVVKA